MKRKYIILVFAGFIIISLFLFSRSMSAQFVSDDWHWLSQASQSSIFPDFLANYAGEHVGGSYNPISSLWVNAHYALFGVNSFPYHASSAILHAINAFLMIFLTSYFGRALVSKNSPFVRQTIPVLSGILFLVWPTHVEAVSWMASVPHLLATFFYLVALIAYLKWRSKRNGPCIWVSLIAAMMALFSKEVAISLPFVIVALELLLIVRDRLHILEKIRSALLFFIPLILYVVARFFATGLLFGSYAEEQVILRPFQIINTLGTFFVEIFSLGIFRYQWMSWYWERPLLSAMITMLVIVTVYILFMKLRWKLVFTAMILFAVSILPFLPLGFNRLVSETERYTYLPSMFAIVTISALVSLLPKKIMQVTVIILVVSCGSLLIHKTNAWESAGSIAEKSIDDVSRIIAENPQSEIFLIGLPDTMSGAHVFRNNIREAIELTRGLHSDIIVQFPIYTILNQQNYSQPLLSWTTDERGFTASSVDGSFLVTGYDRRETPWLIFELWNYDYSNFSSDTIRLILSEESKARIKTGEIIIATWNSGGVTTLSNE